MARVDSRITLSIMRDLFTEGLLYLDLMEVYGSSHLVGEICGIAQSNAYRGAKACARLLNLDLRKQSGSYLATRNLDVQRDLRAVAQRLRARENGQLRWVAEPWAQDLCLKLPTPLVQVLPKRWLSAHRSLEMLVQGLIDCLLGSQLDLAAPLGLSARLPLSRPQVCHSFGLLALSEDPVLLYCDPLHPLHRQSDITLQDFKAYPSPALNLDSDSVYALECKKLNLWNMPLGVKFLNPSDWESLVRDQRMIVPSTARAVAAARRIHADLQIKPLPFSTGMIHQDLLVFPLGLAREPCLQEAIRAVHAIYQSFASTSP